MNNLLLLHGAIGAKDQFEELASILQNEFTVFTMDFSGHGANFSKGDFTISRFANDVLKFISDHGLDTIDIFGYSMGGYVAVYLARHHPEKIGKIFTFATKFHWTPEIALHERKFLDADKIAIKLPAFAAILEKRHVASGWKTVLARTRFMMEQLGDTNPLSVDEIKNITSEVLIGIGDRDTMVTLEESVNTRNQLSNSSLIVFPKTPHPFETIDVGILSFHINRFFKNCV